MRGESGVHYNIHFSVISAIYLSMLTIYYHSLRLLKTERVRLFSTLLTMGLISEVLDAAMAAADSVANLFPSWLLYLGNIVFLFCLQLCGAVLFTYALVINGFYKSMSIGRKLLILLPFAVFAACLLISPFGSSGVFYLDSGGYYHSGATHFMLYACMGVYLIAAGCFIFYGRKNKNNEKAAPKVFLAFLAFAFVGMGIQSISPENLLTSMTMSVGIMMICFVFESPHSNLDALTGTFSKSALPLCLRTAYNQTNDFSLLVFSFKGFSYINHTVGNKTGDAILIYFTRALEEAFPKSQVLRTGGDEFSVVLYDRRIIDADALTELCAPLPRSMAVGEGTIRYHFTTACISSTHCSDYIEMLELYEYLSGRGRVGSDSDRFICGEEFIKKYKRTRKAEQAIRRALDERRAKVYFQPIHDAGGRLTSAEALLRLEDEELGVLPAQECVDIAESNGDILRLGNQVLERVCELISENLDMVRDFDHISVNLSALQCVWSDLPETVFDICSRYEIPRGLISFELTETAAASMVATRRSMDKLINQGHCFFLDDFGTGYANFDHIALLPFGYVKIDKSILWSAMENEQSLTFLRKTMEMLKTLSLKSICEGVETEEQAQLLRSLGVTLLQGYYYSKPLPPADFIEYIRKARASE